MQYAKYSISLFGIFMLLISPPLGIVILAFLAVRALPRGNGYAKRVSNLYLPELTQEEAKAQQERVNEAILEIG